MLAYALAALTALAPMTGLIEAEPHPDGPISATATALAPSALYRVLMVRAAPGELLDLIDLYKAEFELLEAEGETRPFWMRHTQGDHWDLMLIYPMGSFAEYYDSERTSRLAHARSADGRTGAQLDRDILGAISWREDLYVWGPPLEEVSSRFAANDFYHVEIFVTLPGKRDALVEEREMENVFLRGAGRPDNLIFEREAGAEWDCFTLGFYRDLQHYAEVADVPADVEDRAAREAGFESAGVIGNFMRSLILYHNDTLLVSIR